MTRIPLSALALFLILAAMVSMPTQAPAFPLDYSDPASDVVQLNSTTGLCEVDAGGDCITSPQPDDVNIRRVKGEDALTAYNLTIEVQGEIRTAANASYIVNLYFDTTNQTHWVVNYTNGALSLSTNGTYTPQDISGNATVWGPNPTNLNSVSMLVNKTLAGPSNITAGVNIDGTAILRGDPAQGEPYSYQDFGWEVPGRPGASPTILRGHVYVAGTSTPVAGATVTLTSGQNDVTDAAGYYEFTVTPGTYNATAAASGFVTTTFNVTVSLGQTVTHDVQLERTTGGSIIESSWVPIAIGLLALLFILLLFILLMRRRKKSGTPPPPPA